MTNFLRITNAKNWTPSLLQSKRLQRLRLSLKTVNELEVAIAGKGSTKAIIAMQTANAKELRSSLKVANDKLVQKDERIAQLEKVVEDQKQVLEDESESMKTIIAKQTADAKEVSDSLKLTTEKVAQNDELIAQLDKTTNS